MNKYVAVACAAALGVGGLAFTAPAVALEHHVDITAISVPKRVVIESWTCRNIPVTYTVKTDPGWSFSSAVVQVLQNGVIRDTDYIFETGLNPYSYCPESNRLGKWTFGPSDVDASSDSSYPTYADSTHASTYIKVAGRTGLRATRSGSKVSFTATTKRYYITGDSFIAWNDARVMLQRKRSDGTWADVGLMGYTSNGVARKTITSRTTASYRVTTAGNSWVWNSSSGAVRR